MSANWTPQFIVAFGVAVALGNALAIGLHVFTWWLRKRAPLMAAIGCIALVPLGCGLAYVSFIMCDGFNLEGKYAPPDGWQLQVAFAFFIMSSVSFIVIGCIGELHKQQIPARWGVACLCFCFELACALIPLTVFEVFQSSAWFSGSYSFSQKDALRTVFAVGFISSFFALAFFRPTFLIVLKYFRRYIRPNSSDVEQIS